jgi:hypothetical protein
MYFKRDKYDTEFIQSFLLGNLIDKLHDLNVFQCCSRTRHVIRGVGESKG